jgi:hypothetical protein
MNFLKGVEPPPALPSAPLWERLVFDTPLLTAAVLAVVGFVTLLVLRRGGVGAGQKRGGMGLPFRAALCWWLVAAAVGVGGTVWPSERVGLLKETERVVSAAARMDAQVVEGALSERVRLTLMGVPSTMGKAEMVGALREKRYGGFPISVVNGRAKVSGGQATVDGPGVARTQVRVQVVHESSGLPAETWWLLHWQREGGVWRVTGLELLRLNDRAAGSGPGV